MISRNDPIGSAFLELAQAPASACASACHAWNRASQQIILDAQRRIAVEPAGVR
jgi:hypothetical protein